MPVPKKKKKKKALTAERSAWILVLAAGTISAELLALPVPYHGHIENRGVRSSCPGIRPPTVAPPRSMAPPIRFQASRAASFLSGTGPGGRPGRAWCLPGR